MESENYQVTERDENKNGESTLGITGKNQKKVFWFTWDATNKFWKLVYTNKKLASDYEEVRQLANTVEV